MYTVCDYFLTVLKSVPYQMRKKDPRASFKIIFVMFVEKKSFLYIPMHRKVWKDECQILSGNT